VFFKIFKGEIMANFIKGKDGKIIHEVNDSGTIVEKGKIIAHIENGTIHSKGKILGHVSGESIISKGKITGYYESDSSSYAPLNRDIELTGERYKNNHSDFDFNELPLILKILFGPFYLILKLIIFVINTLTNLFLITIPFMVIALNENLQGTMFSITVFILYIIYIIFTFNRRISILKKILFISFAAMYAFASLVY
jgi:hypothetical protein